jgi:hypothetical protein
MTCMVATYYLISHEGTDRAVTHIATVGLDELKALRATRKHAEKLIAAGEADRKDLTLVGKLPTGVVVCREPLHPERRDR